MGLFSSKPKVSADPVKVDELLERGVSEVINRDDLKKELLAGRALRVKLGIDPTSPHLHLGRAVQLLKLRDFQELGHKIVLIIGDATGVIGDTSDKESERPMLTELAVRENLKTYLAQVGLLLNMKNVEVRRNSEWLNRLTYREIGEHANAFSLSDFVARENIKSRLSEGKRVSLREILYPLMQGYDSVAIGADVELGGTDQRFNVLAGRTLQQQFKQKPQNVLLTELIPGLDGRKMSSSWGNTVNLTDKPNDMYGKIMSMNDESIGMYFITTTRIPLAESKRINAELRAGTLHPRDAKMRLAREIVTLYHGKEKAKLAEEAFIETFQEGKVPDDAPLIKATKGALLIELLSASGIVASKTEFKRLIIDGAIKHIEAGDKISDERFTVTSPMTLKVGKRRFVKIEITS